MRYFLPKKKLFRCSQDRTLRGRVSDISKLRALLLLSHPCRGLTFQMKSNKNLLLCCWLIGKRGRKSLKEKNSRSSFGKCFRAYRLFKLSASAPACRRSNRFSFLTAFPPPLSGQQQGRFLKASAWRSIQSHLAYRQLINLIEKHELCFPCLKNQVLCLSISLALSIGLVVLNKAQNVEHGHYTALAPATNTGPEGD